MTRQDPEVAQGVPARWGDGSNQAKHEVFRREDDRARSVFPDALECELERAVGALGEPVLCDRRARDVSGEPLELPAVAPVDDLAGVDVDAAHHGDGIGGVVGRRFWIDRDDEPERREACAIAGSGDALRGGGVTGGEAPAPLRRARAALRVLPSRGLASGPLCGEVSRCGPRCAQQRRRPRHGSACRERGRRVDHSPCRERTRRPRRGHGNGRSIAKPSPYAARQARSPCPRRSRCGGRAPSFALFLSERASSPPNAFATRAASTRS